MQEGPRYSQRDINLSRVLLAIQQQEAISRIDIAKLLELNKSTITSIVTELLQNDVIRILHTGDVSPSGGRKPVFLSLNERFGCILGMEIRHNRCRCVVLNLVGDLLLEKELSNLTDEGGFSAAFLNYFNAIRIDIEALGIPLIGVGLGVPAKVDPFSGRIIDSYSLDLKEYEFGAQVASHLTYPVLVDNDANCCAWGELFAAGKKSPRNFLYVFVEFKGAEEVRGQNVVGVGFGVVINRRVHYGSHYQAGEFRSVFWNDSRKELVSMSSEQLSQINERPTVLRRFIKELLMNLSVVISIIDPECIFIGGDLKPHFPVLEEVLEQELSHRYIGFQSDKCRVVANTFDDYSVARGAAHMFLQKLFHNPTYEKRIAYTSLSWHHVFSSIGKR